MYKRQAETEFKNKGVNIVLGQKVQKFEGTDTVKKVITDKGEYNADLVVLCIGCLLYTSRCV